jgi:phage terminase small subunit
MSTHSYDLKQLEKQVTAVKSVKPRNLTQIKQHKFVNYYIESNNAEQSAIKAGYSAKTARSISGQLLAKPRIREMIEQYKQTLLMTNICSFDWKMEKLRFIVEWCLTPQIIGSVKGAKGQPPTPITRIKEESAIKALELMAKMQGHLAPTQSVQVNVQSTIDKLKDAQIEYKDS